MTQYLLSHNVEDELPLPEAEFQQSIKDVGALNEELYSHRCSVDGIRDA